MFVSPNKLSTYVFYFCVRKSTTTFLVYPIKMNGKMGRVNSVGVIQLDPGILALWAGRRWFSKPHLTSPLLNIPAQHRNPRALPRDAPASWNLSEGCACLTEPLSGTHLPHSPSLAIFCWHHWELPALWLLSFSGFILLTAMILFSWVNLIVKQ